jgi:adenylylsulfate kinase
VIIWLVGLSGAGKSAIGSALYRQMKNDNPATVIVDGDEIRKIFGHDRNAKDYSVEGRRLNAERIRELCAWLDRQDIDVICCILSIFPEHLEGNRRLFSSYFEIFVTAPFDDLVERNPKDLYRLAIDGKEQNVVGVDIEFEPPINSDMVIENTRPYKDPTVIAHSIYECLQRKM